MTEPSESDNTSSILDAIQASDPATAEQLLPRVYAELRRLAAAKMSSESPDHSLEPTALVHEVYLRLEKNGPVDWQSRAQFFSAAATAMRRILIENARRKKRLKRAGDRQRLDLKNLDIAADASTTELESLDEALEKLKLEDPVKAELVMLRFFAGLTIEQAANILRISRATASRYWTYARAWLYQQMTRGNGDSTV